MRGRILRRTTAVVGVLVLAVVLGATALVRTALGHRIVLGWGLDQVRSRVAGTLDVDRIRSATLLDGARLVGLRMRTPDGEAFIEADSLEASWSLLGLVRGRLAFTDVTAWGLEVTYVRENGASTLSHWIGRDPATPPDTLPEGEPPTAGEAAVRGGGLRLDLGDVRLVDAAVSVRLPAPRLDPDGLLRTESGEAGLRLALDVQGVRATVPRVQIGTPGGSTFEVRTISGEARILREPVLVEGMAGQLRLSRAGVVVALQRLGLPGAEGAGSVVVQRGVTEADFVVGFLDTRQWQWLAGGRLPELDASGRVRVRREPGDVLVAITGLDAGWLGGRVRGRGEVRPGRPLRIDALDLELEAVPLTALEPWLAGRTVPVTGDVAGRISLAGPLDALATRARLSLTRPGTSGIGIEAEGVLIADATNPGAGGLRVAAQPFDWTLVTDFVPSADLAGSGSVAVELAGRLDDGIRFTADLSHEPEAVGASRMLLSGSVQRRGTGGFGLDVQGDFSPLSFDGLLAGHPELGIRGSVTGNARARGRLDDLEVVLDLESDGGRLAATGRLARVDGRRELRLDAEADRLPLGALVAPVPEGSRLSGLVAFAGRDSLSGGLAGELQLDLGPSTVGRVDIDDVRIEARVGDGVVYFDRFEGMVEEIALQATGAFALTDSVTGVPPVLRVDLRADSLAGLRSLVRGNEVIVSDGLTALDREVLALRGIDPDTLPPASEVRAEGRLRGELVVSGSPRALGVAGSLRADSVAWGTDRADGLQLDFDATSVGGAGLPRFTASLDATGLRALDRSFSTARARLAFDDPDGRVRLELGRGDREEYLLAGAFGLAAPGGHADLDSLRIRIAERSYVNRHPARFEWDSTRVSVDSLVIGGGGPEPLRIAARGALATSGEERFTLDVGGLRIEQLLEVLQRDDLGWQGVVDLTGDLRGSLDEPRIRASVSARDVGTDQLSVESVEGDLDYDGERLGLDLEARAGERRLLRLDGSLPLAPPWAAGTPQVDAGAAGDTGVSAIADAATEAAASADAGVDLTIIADSVPAAFVLQPLENLENVEGFVRGRVHLGGTRGELLPEGTLEVVDGAWTVGALGVRQRNARATLEVSPDRRVSVRGAVEADGRLGIEGMVQLDSLSNPGLDLALTLDRFRAVDRRDIRGSVSGAVQLLGRFGAPLIEGRLQVEQGDVFLVEFQRNLGVVDLSDPRFFAMDTTLVQSQSLLAGVRNPFLDNLLVIIDVDVARNAWLRSPQLNVEMRGDLSLTFDRRQRDVVFVGELQAVRGQYQILNRTFDVERGTVEFVGIPGINPNLDIEALARVRRRDGEPLDITASVQGTLVEPRVSLSSDEAAVAESDLLSYLAFGQSSAQTTTANAATVASQAGSAAAAALGGTLTSSLAALAQGTGFLDYLSISQAVDAQTINSGASLSSFSGTQVEVGRYFAGGDYFAALVLRPLARVGARGSLLGGARVEWQASDQYHVEVFAEDQFLRSGSVAFQDLGLNALLIYGFALYREWGY